MSVTELAAMQIVKRHSMYSAGAGLLPVPWLDLAAVTGIQVKMLNDLAKLYAVPFSEERGKSLVSALIGGIVPTKMGYGAAGSFIKGIPGIGGILGIFVVPGFAAASTWAVGKVFIQHFASGGTFLDFDPDKVRDHFNAELSSKQSAA
jgi:uncharacterized protein (DUF697 family)